MNIVALRWSTVKKVYYMKALFFLNLFSYLDSNMILRLHTNSYFRDEASTLFRCSPMTVEASVFGAAHDKTRY